MSKENKIAFLTGFFSVTTADFVIAGCLEQAQHLRNCATLGGWRRTPAKQAELIALARKLERKAKATRRAAMWLAAA